MPQNDDIPAATDPSASVDGTTGTPGATAPAAAPPTVTDELLRLLVAGARTFVVPLANVYAHPGGAAAGASESRTLPPTALTPEELAALGRASTKLVLEGGELLLKHFPATPDGSRVAIARDAGGNFPEPTVAYLVAAAKAISHFLDARAEKRAQQADDARGAMPAVTLATAAGPLPVNFLRMQAARPLSSRILAATASQRMNNMPIGSSVSPFHARYTRTSFATVQPSPPSAALVRGSGCGCGCGGGGSSVVTAPVAPPCGPAPVSGPPAACDPFTISCDTKNKLVACFKVALCDFLRALGREACGTAPPTGTPTSKALRAAACSLLACLPEALCPPPPPALPPGVVIDCCNFAVEEVRS